MRSFDYSLDFNLNKVPKKQLRGRLIKISWCPTDVTVMWPRFQYIFNNEQYITTSHDQQWLNTTISWRTHYVSLSKFDSTGIEPRQCKNKQISQITQICHNASFCCRNLLQNGALREKGTAAFCDLRLVHCAIVNLVYCHSSRNIPTVLSCINVRRSPYDSSASTRLTKKPRRLCHDADSSQSRKCVWVKINHINGFIYTIWLIRSGGG